jgi:hypothetical protein
MGLRPTQPNESPSSPPRKRGSTPEGVDSRFRGNDLTFERAKRGISPCFYVLRSGLRQSEIPRFHENDCAEGTVECGGLTPPSPLALMPGAL